MLSEIQTKNPESEKGSASNQLKRYPEKKSTGLSFVRCRSRNQINPKQTEKEKMKATAITLLLMANLYGQVSSANEVTISQIRLQSLNGSHISLLAENGLIRFQNDQAILNLTKFNQLVNKLEVEGQIEKLGRLGPCVPYGNT